MYRFLSTLYPKNMRKQYLELLKYAGVSVSPEKFIGFLLFFGLGIALALSFLIGAAANYNIFLVFLLSFAAIELTMYATLLLRADSKAKFIENILPDVLQLMSSNLRAGLTPDKAFLLSAREEFGPFQQEINLVGKEITLGKEMDRALIDMGNRVKSEKLKKTTYLIVAGLRSGGELATLLDQTAKNLRQQTFVDEKIKANVMMYVIFIFSAVGIGSPILFALSSFLIDVLTKTMSSVSIPDTSVSSAMPISFGTVSLSVDFIMTFIMVSITTSCILGALILGLISKGKEREGIKFIPVLLFLSFVIFFSARYLISNMLSGLFGI